MRRRDLPVGVRSRAATVRRRVGTWRQLDGATVGSIACRRCKDPSNPSFAPRRGCTRWVVQCGQNYAKPTTTRELAPFAVGEVPSMRPTSSCRARLHALQLSAPASEGPPSHSFRGRGYPSRPSDLIFERLHPIRSAPTTTHGTRPDHGPCRKYASRTMRSTPSLAPAQQVLDRECSARPSWRPGYRHPTPRSNCLVRGHFFAARSAKKRSHLYRNSFTLRSSSDGQGATTGQARAYTQ